MAVTGRCEVKVAAGLSVAYLRLNGYFLITEQDLHVREPTGYRSLTDIDIIAIRPPAAPGPVHHRAGAHIEECLIVTDLDPALEADATRFDVIIGEVKTAEASLNPALRTPGALHAALRTPGALHAALRRTGDLYTAPLDEVVDQLALHGASITPTARTRLVAFARYGDIPRGTTIYLREAARFIRSHLQSHRDLYRVSRFADPVVALLELLDKVE
jgi:hypothetical protein